MGEKREFNRQKFFLIFEQEGKILKTLKKTTIAWILFDVAVACFANLVTSFLFPYYVKNFLGGTEFHIGLIISLALLLVAFTTPVLGTYSDVTGRKVVVMRFLVLGVVLAILTASLPVLWLSLIAYLLALFFAHNNLALFGSMLPSVANGRVGTVAGMGVAAGAIGTAIGIGVFAAVSTWFFGGGQFPVLFSRQNIQVLFVIAAAFYLFWALPLLVLFRDRKMKKKVSLKKSLRMAFKNLYWTWENTRRLKNLLLFYVGEFFYNNGIISLGVFLVLYAQTELKLSIFEFALMYLVFLTMGMISSFVSGRIVDKIGPRLVQVFALIFWAMVIVAFMLFPLVWVFFGMGILGALATGMLVAADRPMLVALAPPRHIGQFFGFDEIVGRTSGVIGPFVFGLLITFYGYSTALFSVLVFILLALFFITKIQGKFGKIKL